MDWDRLKELTHGDDGKFDYEFWHDDIKRITSNEGKVSLLQAYIDNSEDKVEVEAIKMIIDAGVDVRHVNNDGKHACWIAFMRTEDVNVFKCIIDSGIDINQKAYSGATIA